jgi:transposase
MLSVSEEDYLTASNPLRVRGHSSSSNGIGSPPFKEDAQQDLQALHRIRDHLANARTALIYERRGWLSESWIVLPKGIARFRQAMLSTLAHEQAKLTALTRHVFRQLHEGRPTREPRLTYDHE